MPFVARDGPSRYAGCTEIEGVNESNVRGCLRRRNAENEFCGAINVSISVLVGTVRWSTRSQPGGHQFFRGADGLPTPSLR